jgi:uncharacterized protein (TIGR02677 family)
MEINQILLKPILEIKYLQAENVERYRVIIRHFFLEYENLNYMLYKEDIYRMMLDNGYFDDYTMDKCQSDLESLVTWGNLIASQDSTKVTSIEEFKNKKYRYQLGEYTVEIERMILKLETLEVEGASLEPQLLDRLYNEIRKFPAILNETNENISSWWRSLNNDFIRLNHEYQDYIRTLNGHKAEEMMKSEEFLVFKDHLIGYLRTFVKGLQTQGTLIASYLEKVQQKDIDSLMEHIVTYELSIPRIERQVQQADIHHATSRRWQSFYRWFLGNNNELERLQVMTNEIIRKITGYAQQIGEMRHRSSNRKEEYRHIAAIFNQCDSLNEAHKLSAYVFGVAQVFHLVDMKERTTDSIDSRVYDEEPTLFVLESRARVAKKQEPRKPAIDYEAEKRFERIRIEEEKERNKKIVMSHIQDHKIDFSTLPKIDAYTRKLLLSWVSKAMQQVSRSGKTEFGWEYRLEIDEKEKVVVHCEDGEFWMSNIRIIFKGENL